MYEKSVDYFLVDFYTHFAKKIQRLLELNSKNANLIELTELYETKGKMIDSLNYMCYINDDKDIQKLFHILADLVISLH